MSENVTFVQAMYGTKFESNDAPDWMGAGLCELTAELNAKRPDENCGGGLGGSDGYGQDFENAVFVMFPYYWGDCDCGHEQRSDAWERANGHRPECYQERVKTELIERHGFVREPWPHGVKKPGGDYGSKERDAVQKRLCKEMGLPHPDGCAVHCTCDHRALWAQFNEEHQHAEHCPIVRPNFLHKKSGLAVHWYKYIGRGMTVNREVTRRDWREILNECLASLAA